MEDVNWSKLDRGMRDIYRSYEKLVSNNWSSEYYCHPVLRKRPEGLRLIIEYTGEKQVIEQAGFIIESNLKQNSVYGFMPLNILPKLTQLDEVVKIIFGKRHKKKLTSSATDIRARASDSNLFDGVWWFNSEQQRFEGNTGKSVVVGVVDTGIDWSHEAFLKTDKSGSRIISIWDQGLDKSDAKDPVGKPEKEPDSGLLSFATIFPYGVEYNRVDIDKALSKDDTGVFIRHRDTDGHGTHVAAIAAGNGMNPSLIGEPDFDRAGIAPEAEIIAVNLLDSEDSTVSDVIKFRDALVYIIEKARVSSPDKAVVINMSFGVSLGAHDGRGDEGDNTDEEVINEVFHEKEGVIGIAAAGNESGIFQHLEITLKGTSPDNIIKIPFFVERNQGYEQDGSSLYIDMWYGIDDNPGVKLWFKPPGGVLSNPSILEGADVVGDFNNGKCEFGIEHTKKESLSDLRGNVTRANIEIYISPKKRKLQLGDGYQLLVSGKENTKIHLWVNPDPNFRINFDKSLIDVEDGVEISDRSTISSPGHCPEIITVGSFEKDRNRLSCFSSRGPVLSYTSSGPIAEKPDVVAPGKQISSAKAEACKCGRGWLYDTYIRFNGTSMSAPHVAGMVALMLEKNNKLKLEKIKEHLKSASEDGGLKYIETDICGNRDDGIETNSSSPIVGKTEVGLGRVNVKATVDLVS